VGDPATAFDPNATQAYTTTASLGSVTLTGSDPAHLNMRPGWLAVPSLIQQASTTANISINIRTDDYTLNSGSHLNMQAANRLSGVRKFTLDGGEINLNKHDQALMAPDTLDSSSILTNGLLHVTANSVIDFGQPTGDEVVRFTIGQVLIDAGSELTVNWAYDWSGSVPGAGGDPTTGMGNVRLITTGYGVGDVVQNMVLWPNSFAAYVNLNRDGEKVFIPVTNDYVWTGNLTGPNALGTPSDTPGWQDQTVVSNWYNPILLTDLNYPGSRGIADDAGSIATFDSETLGEYGGYVFLGYKSDLGGDPGDPLIVRLGSANPMSYPVAGVIRITGYDPGYIVIDPPVSGYGELVMNFLGKETGVAIDVENASHLVINANIRLYFDNTSPIPELEERNPLSVNVNDPGGLVILNGNVAGGYGSITKNGVGTLVINGNNDQMSSGVILNNGTLKLGSDQAVGYFVGSLELGSRGYLELYGGRLQAVKDADTPDGALGNVQFDNRRIFNEFVVGGGIIIEGDSAHTFNISGSGIVIRDSVITMEGGLLLKLGGGGTPTNYIGVASSMEFIGMNEGRTGPPATPNSLTFTGEGTTTLEFLTIRNTLDLHLTGTSDTKLIIASHVVAAAVSNDATGILTLASTGTPENNDTLAKYTAAVTNQGGGEMNITGDYILFSGAVTNTISNSRLTLSGTYNTFAAVTNSVEAVINAMPKSINR
jgi:hypothetical protein